MRNVMYLLILVFAIIAAKGAAAECTRPAEPSLPDGATATKAEMGGAFKAVKEFQTELLGFRECLDAAQTAGGDEITEEIRMISVQRYNASVDAEEIFVDRFNVQFRAYKAANSD